MLGVWHRDGGWDVSDETHSLVENYDEGWAWSVPVAPTVRYFTVMVEPGVTELASGQLETMYRSERSQEVKVLCDPQVREAIVTMGIELCSFSDVVA